MRFATFHHNDALGYGPVTGDEVRPVQGTLRDAYPTLRQAIAADALAEIAAAAASFPAIALAEVALAPPIPDPGKIICVGLNYRAHGDRDGRPDFPAIFTRFADTQIGHGAPLRQSTESAMLDFEAELAVIIARGGRAIPRERALEHVAGYSCYNDATMRDWQKHSTQYTAGKNFPGTGAFGPFLVTADEVGAPHDLTLTLHVDGEELQRASTADMLFSVEEVIAYISRFTPLAPGDVLVTGTPAGSGAGRKPPRFLQPGNVVTVEIERVGRLVNPVAAPRG